MHRYVMRRLLLMVPVLFGISLFIFFIMSLTPGTPGEVILGNLGTPEAIEQLNEDLGYYDPLLVRYARYMGQLVKGNFGESYRTGLPVTSEIFERFPVTLRLAIFSITIAIVFGVPIGVISAVKQYSVLDAVSTMSALAFMSIPQFWLGLMLILTFSLKIDIFPAFGSDTALHYVLPAITSSAPTLATLIRMTRSTMLEVIRQDYVRTAYAKGASKRHVIFHHCLKNALIPVVTVVGLNFGMLLGGTIILESVFGMSGVGNLMISSIRNKDLPVVLGSTLMLALVVSTLNLAADILYAFLDPRIKARFSS